MDRRLRDQARPWHEASWQESDQGVTLRLSAFQSTKGRTTEVVVRIDQPVPAAVQHLERAMIQYALRASGGRMEDTASMLGLSRKGLYLKRRRYGLEPPEGAPAAGVDDRND